MANTVKQISIATDSVNTYSTRDIGADAVNVDVSYDADGNVITDAETTVATKKSSAEAIKTINETLAADAEAINGKAPTSHASADTTYGLGTAENYGHVKLSDDYSSPTMGDDNDEAKYGIGASAFALKSVNQKLEQLRTDIKDLQITQGGSTGVTITRVPEIVLNPQFHKADSDGVYQFILQSALLKKEMPDTTKLILDFETEDISSETKAQITVNSYDGFDEDGLASYAETDYTLTANDIAYGYKYVASETTSTAEGEDGTETETTTQTYSYRVEILLRKQVNVTTGVYSLFFESVPNEKYLNNKCDEISAALDAANIPSDLGTTAGSAISALNTHLTEFDNYSRRTRKNITSSLSNLSKAVAEQDLEKYGYSIGDYFTGASGYVYHLGDMDTYYGGYNSYAVVATHHVGIVVDTNSTCTWLSSGSAGSYSASTLHSYLKGTVLSNIKSDFTKLFGSSDHLVAHTELDNAVGSWGTTWDGLANTQICALSEVQVYGSRIFGCDGFQSGTACKCLEIFRKFRFNEILGNKWWWLRSLSSSSNACLAGGGGDADNYGLSDAGCAVGLILFY